MKYHLRDCRFQCQDRKILKNFRINKKNTMELCGDISANDTIGEENENKHRFCADVAKLIEVSIN